MLKITYKAHRCNKIELVFHLMITGLLNTAGFQMSGPRAFQDLWMHFHVPQF